MAKNGKVGYRLKTPLQKTCTTYNTKSELMTYAKLLLQIVLTLLLSVFFQWYLPWWAMAGASAIVAAWFAWPRVWWSVVAGFLAGSILWGEYAWLLDWQNEHILSGRMGALLGGLSSGQLVLVTALLGGLTAALGAWVGYEAQRLWRTPENEPDA